MKLDSIKLSPFLRQTFGTMVTSVLTIVCLVVMTSSLARQFGPQEFGAFSLIRRVLNMLEPWVTVSMTVSIARYVAIAQGPSEQLAYLRAGFLIQVVMLIVTLAGGLLFPEAAAQLIFRSPEYVGALRALLAITAAYSLYVLLYSYYRGQGRMLVANLWQMAVIAVGPMLVALWWAAPGRLESVVYLNSALLACAIGPLLLNLVSPLSKGMVSIRSAIRDLLRYGIPRVPGSLLYGAILAVGPMGATYLGSLDEAGYLVVAQSLLKIYEGGIEGFSRVAVPAISMKLSRSGKESLKDRVADLVSIILDLGLYLTLHTLLWTEWVITAWLGEGYGGAVVPMKIMTLAICPYLGYVTLRAVLDAVEERALTTGYLAISFVSMMAASGLFVAMGFGSRGFAAGTAIAFFVMGTLSAWRICRDFSIGRALVVNSRVLALNVFVAIGVWAGKWAFYEDAQSFVAQGLVIVALEGAALAVFLFGLNRLGPAWYRAVKGRIFSTP